jgi:hypothetical protein
MPEGRIDAEIRKHAEDIFIHYFDFDVDLMERAITHLRYDVFSSLTPEFHLNPRVNLSEEINRIILKCLGITHAYRNRGMKKRNKTNMGDKWFWTLADRGVELSFDKVLHETGGDREPGRQYTSTLAGRTHEISRFSQPTIVEGIGYYTGLMNDGTDTFDTVVRVLHCLSCGDMTRKNYQAYKTKFDPRNPMEFICMCFEREHNLRTCQVVLAINCNGTLDYVYVKRSSLFWTPVPYLLAEFYWQDTTYALSRDPFSCYNGPKSYYLKQAWLPWELKQNELPKSTTSPAEESTAESGQPSVSTPTS